MFIETQFQFLVVFFSFIKKQNHVLSVAPNRLMTIDESASILSDISYDKTDDSLVNPSFFGIILHYSQTNVF